MFKIWKAHVSPLDLEKASPKPKRRHFELTVPFLEVFLISGGGTSTYSYRFNPIDFKIGPHDLKKYLVIVIEPPTGNRKSAFCDKHHPIYKKICLCGG